MGESPDHAFWECILPYVNKKCSSLPVLAAKSEGSEFGVPPSVKGATILDPIEKFKVTILHLKRDWNH